MVGSAGFPCSAESRGPLLAGQGLGVNGASCGPATCATMGDEVHQLTGWQALQKKKKKKPARGNLAREPGVRRGLPSGTGGAQLGPAKAAWGAARGLLSFTIAAAPRGAALARSLQPRAPWKLASQPPLPTCNLGSTSEAGQPPPSLHAQLAARPGQRSLGIPEPLKGGQRGARRVPRILGLP